MNTLINYKCNKYRRTTLFIHLFIHLFTTIYLLIYFCLILLLFLIYFLFKIIQTFNICDLLDLSLSTLGKSIGRKQSSSICLCSAHGAPEFAKCSRLPSSHQLLICAMSFWDGPFFYYPADSKGVLAW